MKGIDVVDEAEAHRAVAQVQEQISTGIRSGVTSRSPTQLLMAARDRLSSLDSHQGQAKGQTDKPV
ncbi:MAG: hypothetical protein KJZ85_17605 [Rhodobacteraceae bacterium]|jgi:hypothetical protein|nr:hypothetical protein [Paracoccaceae bacterium]